MTGLQPLNNKIHINGKTTQQEANKTTNLESSTLSNMMLMTKKKNKKNFNFFYKY